MIGDDDSQGPIRLDNVNAIDLDLVESLTAIGLRTHQQHNSERCTQNGIVAD